MYMFPTASWGWAQAHSGQVTDSRFGPSVFSIDCSTLFGIFVVLHRPIDLTRKAMRASQSAGPFTPRIPSGHRGAPPLATLPSDCVNSLALPQNVRCFCVVDSQFVW